MKRLMSFMVFALIAFTMNIAAAASGITYDAARGAGFDRLSESEKAEILKTIASKAEAKAKAEAPTPVATLVEQTAAVATTSNAEQWLNVGERIGKMFGSAAKEAGIAVNEFAKSPVGSLAMALIVWHYMGATIAHLFGGVLVLIAGACFIVWVARRRRHVVTTYQEGKLSWLGNPIVLRREVSKMDDDTFGWTLFFWFITVAAALVTMFTF